MPLPPRRACRADANQAGIVQALRKAGAYVLHIGHPFDLLAGYRGRWVALEIKDPAKPPAQRLLTDDQMVFFRDAAAYQLPATKVETAEDALPAVGAM